MSEAKEALIRGAIHMLSEQDMCKWSDAHDRVTIEALRAALEPVGEGWVMVPKANELAERIRSAIRGHETWHVMNRAEDGFCMEFASPEYLNPQRACEKWLSEQPPEWLDRNGYHAVKSFTYTGAERLALEAADMLAASPKTNGGMGS